MKDFGNVDSKYRFIIIASKRAKELLKGAKPRLKSKSRNAIRIAQSEVKLGMVDFEILPTKLETLPEVEERVFLGGEGGGDFDEGHAEAAPLEVKPEAIPVVAGEDEIGVDFSDEFEPLAGAEEEEKEEGAEEESEDAEEEGEEKVAEGEEGEES